VVVVVEGLRAEASAPKRGIDGALRRARSHDDRDTPAADDALLPPPPPPPPPLL